ncbi:sialic acid-binding Ig-like lectin 14 [Stegastes partitus]|uniref:Sialic acid-binding Ig-like lectin 14 n=1 Tax=Stegastes partitus TaxID=144197 RepID=A0A3B5AD23_9TELE|nr:PREDICTED: sialic acid-binding Ig-like lectin 14 [Stegastes partitus]
MDVLKWPLVFGCLCVNVIQTEASSWTVKVPSSVKGLPGSCVVIPCSFNYPDPPREVTAFTGAWMDDTNHLIYHPDQTKMLEQYRSRVTLLGDPRHKNCSLQIDPLQQSNSGPFHFRIEITDYDSYSYRNNKVSISMISQLDPIKFTVKKKVKEGQTVSAFCSVSHSCPTFPPVFNWNRNGEQHFNSQRLNEGQWEATSTLTFQPTHADHNKPLRCNVTYRGGQRQYASETLEVKFTPVNVKVEYKSDIKEGETVHLKCSSDAHPPASYVWLNGTGAQLHKGNIYVVKNVSRHPGGDLFCTATNAEGERKSSPVKLDVLYAPEIKAASSCSSEGSVVKCVCMAESKPPSTVHFVLPDRVLQSTKVEKHGLLTIGTLQADVGSWKFLSCVANNTVGNANVTLSLSVDGKMQYVFIAIGAGLILMLLLIAVGVVKKCRGRAVDATVSSMSTTKTEKAVDLPQYSTTKARVRPSPEKECYDDVDCGGIYANDHIYGNMEADEDDAVYANV